MLVIEEYATSCVDCNRCILRGGLIAHGYTMNEHGDIVRGDFCSCMSCMHKGWVTQEHEENWFKTYHRESTTRLYQRGYNPSRALTIIQP